jgi:hypothetical protein
VRIGRPVDDHQGMAHRVSTLLPRRPIALPALFVALGGRSYAAVRAGRPGKGDDDVIYGCLGENTGRLRVVDGPARRGSLETPISLNRRGEAGRRGRDGDDGQRGKAGEDGARGATGPAGRDGVNGAAGRNGADGAAGPAGRDGVDGAPGEDGAAGRDGVDGAAGRDGATGPAGETGPAGPKVFPSRG